MKRIVSLIIAVMMLCSCQTAQQPTLPTAVPGTETATTAQTTSEKFVEPISEGGYQTGAFNETGNKMLQEIFQSIDQVPYSTVSVGKEIPDISAKQYKGEEINFASYKGMKVLIELVSYWCAHCQLERREYLPEILKNNPDVEYIEVFVNGSEKDENKDNTDTIAKFYEDAKVQIGDETILETNSEIVDYAQNDIKIQYFPSFLFFDESGRMSWFYEGDLTNDIFTKIRKYAYDDGPRLYENLSEGLDNAWEYKRTWEDVRADLTSDARDMIERVNDNDPDAIAACYSNVAQRIVPDEPVVSSNNKTFDMAALSGITVYAFFSEHDENILKEIDALKKFDSENEEFHPVIVILEDAEIPVDEFVEQKGIEFDGVIFSAVNIPKPLYHLYLFGIPTLFMVDESNKVVLGSASGDITADRLALAKESFTGENRVISSLKNKQ